MNIYEEEARPTEKKIVMFGRSDQISTLPNIYLIEPSSDCEYLILLHIKCSSSLNLPKIRRFIRFN